MTRTRKALAAFALAGVFAGANTAQDISTFHTVKTREHESLRTGLQRVAFVLPRANHPYFHCTVENIAADRAYDAVKEKYAPVKLSFSRTLPRAVSAGIENAAENAAQTYIAKPDCLKKHGAPVTAQDLIDAAKIVGIILAL